MDHEVVEIKTDELNLEKSKFTVGVNEVVGIIEHTPKGTGDLWFYDVYKKDGSFERFFKFIKVRKVVCNKPNSVEDIFKDLKVFLEEEAGVNGS